MTYRLIALDLDGTLLDSQLQIRPRTIEALQLAREQGVQVMIVTGRHHSAAYAYWHQLGLDLPAICCNGAYIYDFKTGKALAGDPLPPAEARAFLKLARAYPAHLMVYTDTAMVHEHDDVPLQEGMGDWAARLPENLRPRLASVASFDELIESQAVVWKFLAVPDDTEAMEALLNAANTQGFYCVRSGGNRIDISRAGNSKGKRLVEFIEQRGLSPDQVIAFGDQDNDREMLQLAGLGVAMGNAHEDVRASADWVTGPNDGDGIGDALQRFVLTAT